MENLLAAKSVPAISTPPASGEKPASRRTVLASYDTLAGHRFLFPIVVFLVHYLIVQVTATLSYVYGTPIKSSGPYEGALGPPRPMAGFWENLVGPLRLWDGLWYKQVADKGYDFGEANAAFWPTLPWVMKYGSKVTGLQPEVVGYFFANACFLVALIVLYQLIRIDFSQTIVRRTLWAVAIFPTAFFFTAVYTEAPFLLFASLSLLCARKGEWLAAGAVGLIAALTRSQGVMLLAPFGVLFIHQYGFNLRRWFPNALFLGLPAFGPVFFALFLYDKGFKLLAPVIVQSQWNRGSALPWETFECAIRGCTLDVTSNPAFRDSTRETITKAYLADGADWSWVRQLWENPSWSLFTSRGWRDLAAQSDTLELVVTVLFICLAIIGLFKLPLWMSAFVWPPLIVPLLQPSSVHPLMSMPRFVLVLFPLFIVLAMLLEGRWIRAVSAVASVALLVMLTLQFSQWYWVS